MICHKYKTIFIHIPKTGGTSIECMFGMVRYMEGKVAAFSENVEGKHFTCHRAMQQYGDNFEEYYKWTVVRNPWTRDLSIYNMMKGQLKYRHMSFAEFLNEVTIKEVKAGERNVFRNQTDYILNDGEIKVDQIIRYENLKYGWNEVCKKLGKPHEELVHLRKAKKNQYSQVFSGENIKLIAELRREDIQLLGYEPPYIID